MSNVLPIGYAVMLIRGTKVESSKETYIKARWNYLLSKRHALKTNPNLKIVKEWIILGDEAL